MVALIAGTYTYLHLLDWGAGAADFSWPLRGAQRLLAGLDPYNDPSLGPQNPYPSNFPLAYPMPALLIALPFTCLPPEAAAATFFGLSSGLLAFALTRMGWAALVTFASQTFWYAAGLAQWSPLVMAAILLPWLYPVIVAKPNLGVPAAIAFPSRLGWALAGLTLILSIIVYPTWVASWLGGGAESGVHFPPVVLLPGPLLLLSALHWRLPTGRLLLLLSFAPQTLSFSDQLILFLIPRSGKQFAYMAAATWACFGGWMLSHLVLDPGVFAHTAAFWVIMLYLCALGLVLAQGHGLATTGNLTRVTLPAVPAALKRFLWWWSTPALPERS